MLRYKQWLQWAHHLIYCHSTVPHSAVAASEPAADRWRSCTPPAGSSGQEPSAEQSDAPVPMKKKRGEEEESFIIWSHGDKISLFECRAAKCRQPDNQSSLKLWRSKARLLLEIYSGDEM